MKKTEITNIGISMGTVDFMFKGANLRKAQHFTTYPIAEGDTKIFFQSDKRWMELDIKTNKLMISNEGNTAASARYYGMSEVQVDSDTLTPLLEKIRQTGGNAVKMTSFLLIDNSGANKI